MNDGVYRPGPLLVDVAGTRLTDADAQVLSHRAVGGVILFTRNFDNREQLAELTAAMRDVRPNLLITADQEGGRVQRFREGFTPVVPMRAIGDLARRNLAAAITAAREIGWLLAVELARVGVDMPLAPVVDLDYGFSEVIGDRAFAGDADTVIALSRALAQGLRGAGSVATAKHFPGHGYVPADSHAELPSDERDRARMADDVAPYAALVADGLESVMMAHVRYPAVDSLPASLSRFWIAQVLRAEIGFDGCIFCDDLSMGGAAAIGDYRERARLAQTAGCDYVPVCNNRDAVLALLDAVLCDDEAACLRREHLHAACRQGVDDSDAALEDSARWQAATELNARLAQEAGGGA
ncbi:beta-N-acetylhexosaminidase [Salinisphaera aquimarina]|uniref:beta-N-acetylhexosaminidase n=1 Tax=Salinisphaera aquimarina TaxID=2094031 RepID=A0ABV7ERL9_9GAMM